MLNRLICLIIGYAFGCLQTAYFISKLVYKMDIRNYGSGNAGATNMMRVIGMKSGMITLILDVIKGALALIVCGLIFGFRNQYLLLWGGLGVILGHNYPFYLHFKGGKGVAATLGICLAFDFRILVIAGIPSLVLLYAKRYMSLASMNFTALMLILTVIFYIGQVHGIEVILLVAYYTGSCFVRHRTNIRRLREGTENKIGHSKETQKGKEGEDTGDE